jgi:hypothetical protein
VSGGFWEERNAKVTKTIKIQVEWTVSDCYHLDIRNEGEKKLPLFFLEQKERFRGGYKTDSTLSGGFWEERKAKVHRTIKTHVEWTVSDCGCVETPLFLSRAKGEVPRRRRKIVARSEEFRHCLLLILCSCE